MSASEILAELHARGATTSPVLTKPPAVVVSEVLGYQARIGKVDRVRRGLYTVVPGAISRTTRWRCLHWHDGLGQEF